MQMHRDLKAEIICRYDSSKTQVQGRALKLLQIRRKQIRKFMFLSSVLNDDENVGPRHET